MVFVLLVLWFLMRNPSDDVDDEDNDYYSVKKKQSENWQIFYCNCYIVCSESEREYKYAHYVGIAVVYLSVFRLLFFCIPAAVGRSNSLKFVLVGGTACCNPT